MIMKCHEPGVRAQMCRTTARGAHETKSEIDPEPVSDPSSPRAHCSSAASSRVPQAQADSGAKAPAADDPAAVKVYEAEVTKKQIPLLVEAGQDAHELAGQAPERGTGRVEVYLTEGAGQGRRARGRRAHRAEDLGRRAAAAQGRGGRRLPARTAARAA